MVSRRPNETVGILDRPFHDGIEALEGAARRQQGNLVAACANGRELARISTDTR